MGEHSSRDSQPAIREISVDEDGSQRTLNAPASPTGPAWWFTVLVVLVASAALGYGFLLGRGDRPADRPTTTPLSAPTTIAPPTTPSTVLSDLLPHSHTSFVRALPGHDLGSGVTEYLDANRFHTIAVDAGGFVWSGGPSGVVRLDPETGAFAKLTSDSGAGPVDARAIATGPDGSAWVATGRGLSRWDGDEWANDSRFPLRGLSPSSDFGRNITALEVDADGRAWLATHTWPLLGWNGEPSAQIHWAEPPFVGDIDTVILDGRVSDIAADPSGAIWALAGNDLWNYDGEWVRAKSTGVGEFQSMAIDATGNVWLSREGRVRVWNGEDLTEIPWPEVISQPDEPFGDEPEVWVQSLAAAADPASGIWALTTRWVPEVESERQELVSFGEAGVVVHPLPGDDYRAMAVAPDGSVWLAAGDRIAQFSAGTWTDYRVEGEPPLGRIHDVSVGIAGDLWLANDTGILHRIGEDWQQYGSADLGFPPADETGGSNEFWVAAGPEGIVWGGEGCRVSRFDDDGWRALPLLPEFSAQCWNRTVAFGPDGAPWMSAHGYAPFLYRWDGTAWQALVVPPDGDLRVAVGPKGTVWSAHGSGISVLDGEEWRAVLTGKTFYSIAVAGDGSVWAAGSPWSDVTGLWHYDGETWEIANDGRSFTHLETGPDGGVWALEDRSDRRAALVEVETGRTRWIVEEGQINDLAIAADGTVWIGGYGRLYRVDPPG